MLFAPFVAYSYFRDGKYPSAGMTAAVFVLCLTIYVMAPKPKQTGEDQYCYTDWDGRANPTVCE